MTDADADPAAAARERLLAEEAATVDSVLDAADAVATDWPRLADGRPATPDRAAVVGPLRTELDRRGVLDALTALLETAVDAAGYALPAAPVPAPPYVAVTSTGPVLRGTVEAGRLVVALDCFDVVREPAGIDAPVAYARGADEPAAALSVSFTPSRD